MHLVQIQINKQLYLPDNLNLELGSEKRLIPTKSFVIRDLKDASNPFP
ncbi:hypothetical protein M214_2012 [Acinetobacter baumannii CI86]|nr:hypothetical protein M214_2012 [Acinetobacter baumannii CI86]